MALPFWLVLDPIVCRLAGGKEFPGAASLNRSFGLICGAGELFQHFFGLTREPSVALAV
jgi:hypothetical protein